MPVELNITESVTSLDTTVVQVTLESASEPGPAGPGVAAGGTAGQVLTKDSGTDYDTSWQDATGGGGGAPDDADYLVGTASGDLSAEIVVGTSPGGELGGTWASPTVDATHSGSSHAGVQAAAEATAAAALSAHDADTTGIHGIADTSALALTASHPTNATFNDHSARHEDGGADEISIAGLSGTPAALTTHEADTTAVHGIADTSLLALTSAHPTNATFNDHSARHENGGADEISIAGLDGTPTELTNHLSDSSDAHDASAISVLDTAANFTGTDVEAVLAELQDNIDSVGGGSFDPDEHMPWYVEWPGMDPFGGHVVARTGWATTHTASDGSVQLSVGSTNQGGGMQYGGTAQNDSVEWDIVLAAGTWNIQFEVVKYIDCGIITITVDGSSVGTVDTYAAGATYNQIVGLTGISVPTTGKHRIKFAVLTKNASSSGYVIRGQTRLPIRMRRTA